MFIILLNNFEKANINFKKAFLKNMKLHGPQG